MQRRGFLGAMLAAAAAPAIVRAGSIMRINPRIIVPLSSSAVCLTADDFARRYQEILNRAVNKLSEQIEHDMMTNYASLFGGNERGIIRISRPRNYIKVSGG